MTTPLTKLIAENKERPIAELTLDYCHGYAVSKRIMVKCAYPETSIFNVYCTRVWEVSGYRSLPEIKYGEYDRITHFRPLPDDRLARCFEILLNAALSAKEQNHIYEAAADIEVALQQITTIAEGKE